MLAKRCLLVVALVLLSLGLAHAQDPPAVHPLTGEELVIDCLRGTPVAIDGDLSDWPKEEPAAIEAGAGREARVRLAFDAKHLHAAFRVADDSPMQNAGKDFALLFKTGDAKRILHVALPSALFLTPSREQADKAPDFCMSLRKHLTGAPLIAIIQPGSERIVEFQFDTKEGRRILLLELFSKGNILLLDH